MKEQVFLRKLHGEGKLKLVEPSDEISKAYLQKSSKSLTSSKALIKIGNLEDSIALSYYSMYHCLTALIFKAGIKCENHTAAIIMLKDIFNIDNHTLLKAKSERIDKQYYVGFSISENEAKEAIKLAEEFIAKMNDFVDKISRQDIQNFRVKLKGFF